MLKKKVAVIGTGILLCFLFIFMVFAGRVFASEAVQTQGAQTVPNAAAGSETETPAAPDHPEGLVTAEDGKIYYYENGIPVTNTLKGIGSKKYYFTSDGSALTDSWKTLNKTEENPKGDRYYFGENGTAYKGSRRIGDKYYVFKEDSVLARGDGKHVVKYKDRKYYVTKGGKAISGWQIYNYQVIYAYKSGKLAMSRKVSYIKFNAKGYAKNKYQALAKIYARKFIDKHTKSGWSKKKKLKKCFYYLLHHRHYVAHYVGDHRAYTTNTWQYKAAYHILSSKRLTGNCRNFAAGFAAIAKELGYKPVVWSMKTHSAVKINGKYYDSLYGKGLFAGPKRAKYVKPNKFKF